VSETEHSETVDEGVSVREAADWCGSGVTVREVPGYGESRTTRKASAVDETRTLAAAVIAPSAPR
jgi:hypothetical protein